MQNTSEKIRENSILRGMLEKRERQEKCGTGGFFMGYKVGWLLISLFLGPFLMPVVGIVITGALGIHMSIGFIIGAILGVGLFIHLLDVKVREEDKGIRGFFSQLPEDSSQEENKEQVQWKKGKSGRGRRYYRDI